jgi:hypothetical protein
MHFKGTAVLFLLLIFLAVFVYFTEFRGSEDREQEEASKTRVLQIDAKDVT